MSPFTAELKTSGEAVVATSRKAVIASPLGVAISARYDKIAAPLPGLAMTRLTTTFVSIGDFPPRYLP
jgi:hypothetical protein